MLMQNSQEAGTSYGEIYLYEVLRSSGNYTYINHKPHENLVKSQVARSGEYGGGQEL